jgi:hypothetical protein
VVILIGNWPGAKLCMLRRLKVKSCQAMRPNVDKQNYTKLKTRSLRLPSNAIEDAIAPSLEIAQTV